MLDPTPRDGDRGGTCTAGQNKGLPCDVMARNTVFPAVDQTPSGGSYSLDCFPSRSKNISGIGLEFHLDQSTGTARELQAVVSCQDSLNPDDKCPCLVCSGDSFTPCNDDDDCEGIGECSSTGTGTTPETNQCNNKLCTALPDGGGECTTGPDLKYCEGLLRPDGRALFPCFNDESCSPPNTESEIGPCSLLQRRTCLPDPITALGQADPIHPVLAAVSCMPPTGGASRNQAIGLPGPARIVEQTTMKSSCGTAEYAPGAGCADGLD